MKKALFLIVMLALPSLVHTSPAGAASTLRFVAIEDGDIYSVPEVGSKAIGRVKQWDLLDVTFNPATPGWLSFETLTEDRTTVEAGYYCGNEATPVVGGVYTFTIIVDDNYKNAPGILVKLTGYTVKLWHNTVDCKDTIYRPLRQVTKFVRSDIGVISSDAACDLQWRIEKIKGRNWPNYIDRFCLTHFVTAGMTEDMVRISLGNPDRINTEYLSGKLVDQWSYNKGYPNNLYFENGILTSYKIDKSREQAIKRRNKALGNPVVPDYPSTMED
jgi:hypothetical protein